MTSKIKVCQDLLGTHYGAEQGVKTTIVDSVQGIWENGQDGVVVISRTVPRELIISNTVLFYEQFDRVLTHQELFPELNLLRNDWRPLEIRESVLILQQRIQEENELGSIMYELAGIDCLPYVLGSDPDTVLKNTKDSILLYPGTVFTDRFGYLSIACSLNHKTIPSPALHNPMRPEYQFLIIGTR